MKHTILLFFLILIPGFAFADSYFQDSDLSSLRLTTINQSKTSVEIINAEGDRHWVMLGDTIANMQARIIKIESTTVTVKNQKGQTKIPIVKGKITGRNSISFY